MAIFLRPFPKVITLIGFKSHPRTII